jgi:hypothetical protein
MVRLLGGDEHGFLKEGDKTYLLASMSPVNSPTFFCLNVDSPWLIVGCIGNHTQHDS